jgi:sortase A
MKAFTWGLSAFFIVAGIALVGSVIMPIAQYELLAQGSFKKDQFLSPIISKNLITPVSSLDLTHAKNWFIGAPDLPEVPSKIKYYNLSIPKLKIKDAVVEIGGDDLSKNLIQYKGTAIPGRPGNPVIFGHSTLPQLFNPKNYLSIFSTLPTLKKGDEVFIDYDGIRYRFVIEEMFEVQPEDVQVLEQRYDGAYLTLVTCVPPGTYLRRLVVRARLVPTL